MQDKIIAAIAAYLETRIYFGYRIDRKDAEKLAEDIYAAAIAPLVEAREPKKCGNCNKNEARLLHACPYREELYNDEETPCDCCFECTGECKDRV